MSRPEDDAPEDDNYETDAEETLPAELPDTDDAPHTGMLARLGSVPLLPDAGAAGAPLTAVIAVISFLAALSLASFFVVSSAATQWTSDLKGSLTVQVKGPSRTEIERQSAEAVRVLLSTDGVKQATAMPRERAEKLLEPWLGRANIPDDLPLPSLVSVEIDPRAPIDLDLLRTRLSAAAPNATLDDHRVWNDRLAAAARTGQGLAFAVFAIVLAAACAISIFAARAGLAANREIVDVLHLVGATDKFIAGEVQRRFIVLGLRGSLLGVAAAWAALMLVAFGANAGGETTGYFLPNIRPDLTLMAWLLVVPAAACLVSAGAARATVLRALSQRY